MLNYGQEILTLAAFKAYFHHPMSVAVLANWCQRSSDTQAKAQTQAAAAALQFIALPARSSISSDILDET